MYFSDPIISDSKLQLIQAVQAPKLTKCKGFIHSFMFETTFQVIQKFWWRELGYEIALICG